MAKKIAKAAPCDACGGTNIVATGPFYRRRYSLCPQCEATKAAAIEAAQKAAGRRGKQHSDADLWHAVEQLRLKCDQLEVFIQHTKDSTAQIARNAVKGYVKENYPELRQAPPPDVQRILERRKTMEMPVNGVQNDG